jgi:hypothetical protein
MRCAAGYVCIYQEGNECGVAGWVGRCEATGGMMCSTDYDPVCGCDGKTYSNACEAQYHHGVSVKAKGACPTGGLLDPILNPPAPVSHHPDPATDGGSSSGGGGFFEPRPCGGPNGRKCPLAQFCKLTEGTCTTRNTQPEGMCASAPLSCNEHTLPAVTQVCGCDGKTYRTDCHAYREGVSVLYRGACFSQEAAAANEEANPKACGGRNARLAKRCPADGGQFCEYEQGVCGLYDAAGTCTTKPEVCSEEVDPVCGCDGKTYTNACEMRRAGVSLKSTGSCPNVIHTIDDGFGIGGLGSKLDILANNSTTGLCNPAEGMPCPSGYYCAFEPGKCLGKQEMGICVVQPAACTPSSASHPVCTCSGATFATECDAAMAGQSLVAETTCLEMSIASGAAGRGVVGTAFAIAAAAVALALTGLVV